MIDARTLWKNAEGLTSHNQLPLNKTSYDVVLYKSTARPQFVDVVYLCVTEDAPPLMREHRNPGTWTRLGRGPLGEMRRLFDAYCGFIQQEQT